MFRNKMAKIPHQLFSRLSVVGPKTHIRLSTGPLILSIHYAVDHLLKTQTRLLDLCGLELNGALYITICTKDF